MNAPTLWFCIGMPVVFGAVAIVTHLVLCHTERLRRTLPDFVNGDSNAH